MTDAHGQSATGYVTITSPPGAPAAAADAYACPFNATCAIGAANGSVLANDASPNNGANLSVIAGATGAPAHGSVVLAADGTFNYSPDT